MRKVLCLVLLVALLGLTGCQMVGGLGEDITWIAQKADAVIVD